VIVGGSVSITVTLNVQRFVLPLESVAIQLTGVAPSTKGVPDAGEQATVAEPQLSETTGENETV
jgi:hypothetical protein